MGNNKKLKLNIMKQPSDFIIYPWSCLFGKSEYETIARNIMVILSKTNDNQFRLLTWEEYKEHRLKDGNFSEREKPYFDSVASYCTSAEKARTFSKTWKEII